ncbi:unnamed protein product [Mytilus coruscus]|uniref:Uncharacterized protein n=1 Tax=Mytilus coruscus TaxID=42192 RepID=A0A6J8CNC6_MYTCO|nr:unnamed protein product [Mytilus coruscus]
MAVEMEIEADMVMEDRKKNMVVELEMMVELEMAMELEMAVGLEMEVDMDGKVVHIKYVLFGSTYFDEKCVDGTWDLTSKDGKFISLKSRDNSNVNQLTKIYKEIHAFISDFPTLKLAFLELPYYSIFHWNAYKSRATPVPFKNDDYLLIEQIDAVNSFIRETNILLRKYSPKFNCDTQNCRKSSGSNPRYTYKF